MEGPDNMRGTGTGPARSATEQLRGFGQWWRGASWKMRSIALIPVAIIVIVALLMLASRFFTDYWWFQEVGHTNIFWTRIWARVVVMVVAGVVFFGVFYGNVRLARHLVPKLRRARTADSEVYDLVESPPRGSHLQLLLISIGLAIVFGLSYGDSWTKIWLYLKQSDFGFTAPVFGRDASFFVFSLPVARTALTFAMVTVALSFIGALVIYILNGAMSLEGRSLRAAPHVKAHLSVLLAVAMLGKAADYMLNLWGLAYSERGATFGPSYTDVNVQMPVLRFLAIIAVVAAVLFLVNIYFRGWRLPIVAIGLLFVTWLAAGQIYPAIVQHFRVLPTEIEKETPYIANNIESTRWAFGLNELKGASFPAATNLDLDSLGENAGTIDNVRLWDTSTALRAYRQIQEIRTYYSLTDVDVDRYMVDGRYRQLMLAVREFDHSKLAAPAQTWVNQHLTYTHGFGVVASPVSEAGEQGLPELYVRDIPPRGVTSLEVTRPEIYYGELPRSFVLVKTTAKEFNYPLGDENVFTEYEGKGGVEIGSFGRKLMFSIRYASIKLLVSDYLRSDSRILFRRAIPERVQAIAPFLQYDRDPYIVIRDDGSLVWMWDAYTTTDLFPYSQPDADGINYIRNSVKVVIDAYNGDATFYQMDPGDAIINAWGGVFPGLFTPAAEMPADLKEHMRYPEDMLTVQARTLAVYHMTQPQVFYNKEDVWEIPTEQYGGEEITVVPYYAVMVLPGESEEEMILMQPFAPRAKQNMVSWMAARMDGEAYGDIVLITFPKDKLVFGPQQIEARITNDPVISAQITLWDQAGSQAIRGNLLVVPVADSLVYVEPLYLQAEQSAIPELTRVIVAYGNQVVMERDLRTALRNMFTGGSTTTTTPGGSTTTVPGGPTTTAPGTTSTSFPPSTTTTLPGGLPTDRAELLDLAQQLYDEARQAQRNDDWSTYGEKIRLLGEVIATLQALE